MRPFTWGAMESRPARPGSADGSLRSNTGSGEQYVGPAKLLSKNGRELSEVRVALRKHPGDTPSVAWDGLVETADKSPIDRLVRWRSRRTLVLRDGTAATVVIRRFAAQSPIAAVTGSGDPPF